MEKFKKIPLQISIVIAGALISVAIIVVNYSKVELNKKNLGPEQVSSRVLDYVDKVLLEGKVKARLESVSEEKGVYKIIFFVNEQRIESYATKDGGLFFPQGVVVEEKTGAIKEIGKTIGDFLVTDSEICLENGKPIIYYFGSEACIHCKWEEPIIDEVAKTFKDQISFHKNIDTEKDRDVFLKYNQKGNIPMIVAGCKFYRIGSGESVGKEEETKNLTAIFCKLTGGEPGSACNAVKDKINEIKY